MRSPISVCALIGFLVLVPIVVDGAPILGSVHDFSSRQAFIDSQVRGVCRECHNTHVAYEIGIWERDLVPNAVDAGDLCLDCHGADLPPVWASGAPDDKQYLNNSRHDFTDAAVAPKGHCFACHELHYPDSTTVSFEGVYFTNAQLWIRDLTGDLGIFYQKRNLGVTSDNDKPNYLINSSILCYDCHSGDESLTGPIDTDFSPYFPPLDIAYGGDRDVQGGTVGYYELPDGTEPTFTNSAPSMTAVRDSAAVPGGHYVKSFMNYDGVTEFDNYPVTDPDSNVLYEISIGDKLPCDLCHDPHMGNDPIVSDEVFFRRNVYAGENTIVRRSETRFPAGSLTASPKTDNGSGDGRLMCIYCHGTSDWDHTNNPFPSFAPLMTDNGSPKLTIFAIKINTTGSNNPTDGSSNAFPPPDGPVEHTSGDSTPCTNCHDHNNIEASCGGCHDYPPVRGAHSKHAMTQTSGGLEITCDACHGVGAEFGQHVGHPLSARIILPRNVTLIGSSTYEADYSTTRPSWFTSTWGSGATDVTYTTLDDFACVNVQCHGQTGGESVRWDAAANSAIYNNVCLTCHDITVSSFQLPGGSTTVYQATNAAANYEGPISGFSRGGHGDSGINDVSWFEDTAGGTSVPVACSRCHDESMDHFPVATANPYRVSTAALNNSLLGNDPLQTAVTNLCTQNNCHPKTPTVTSTGTYAFTEAPKHPNDHFTDWSGTTRYIFVTDGTAAINNQSAGSSTTNPHYDPVGVDSNGDPVVGIHIDRYVDHWEWWNSSSPATSTNADDVPFLPLGDSLSKGSGDSYDNATNVLVTCITCHNPHGTDLRVVGQTPDSASSFVLIPANKMLRLRDQDGELCDACHN